ncbi:MAG: hypothetical protein JEZ00_10065 [Anaerolineaceae bacterium]|nr:hypothetical protein [Anaerolineaceae bacterium]
MKNKTIGTKILFVFIIIVFTVSACSPITIKDNTVWLYNTHNYGACPVEGESRVIKFATTVDDKSGQINRVWLRYRYVIPESVRGPLGLDPIYGPYHEINMIPDNLVTSGGVGDYYLEVDAGTEMPKEKDFAPGLMGVNIEYRIYVENKNQDVQTSTHTMIFCYR